MIKQPMTSSWKSENSQIARAVLGILREHVPDPKARGLLFRALNLDPGSKIFTHGKVARGTITLVLLTDRGIQTELARHFAGVIELVHRASLVADDLQDGHSTRYGQPSFWKDEGVPITVSVLMHLALIVPAALDPEYLSEKGLSLPKARRIRSLFISRLLSTNIGQVNDVRADQVRFSVRSYLRIAGLKTAGLFELIGELCSNLTHGSRHKDRSMTMYLRDLGIVHQIRDDLNELYEMRSARRRDEHQIVQLIRGLPYALYVDSMKGGVNMPDKRGINSDRRVKALLRILLSPEHIQRCETFCGEHYAKCLEHLERSKIGTSSSHRLRLISDFLAKAKY